VRLHEEPIPSPRTGEALVRVTSVGICGSDLHWLSEGAIGDARLTKPLVLGHEFAGTTEEGERVAVDPAVPCGRCESCLEGNPNFCIALRFAGHADNDGALQEYVVWPVRNLHRLPESMSDADGAMLEPLGVALHAVGLAHLRLGMTVGVFGCGPIGLLIIQLARASGVGPIVATDRLSHRLDAAREFGAASTYAAEDGSEASAILSDTHQRGVDVAFEVAGENASVMAALDAAKPGARVVLVGIPADDRTVFTASVARRKGLTLLLSRRMKPIYPQAIRLVQSGVVNVRSLVTHHFPLQEYATAFATALRRDGLKVIVNP
jgi:L-iditol 2-dehydrogenase